VDCEQAKELMVEFLYDELPAESIPGLKEHLAQCRECLEYKEEMQQTLEYLDQNVELRAPLDLAVLHDAIDRKRHRVRKFLHRGWPAWVAIGVCAIMLSTFTLFASEIRYEDGALTVRFNAQGKESLAEKTERTLATYREDQLRFQNQLSSELSDSVTASEKAERMLAAYREEQLRFQNQLSSELNDSVATLSRIIGEYEIQRNRQLAGAFDAMQVQQHEMLMAIQRKLQTLALQTEKEFRRSYYTMAALADYQ